MNAQDNNPQMNNSSTPDLRSARQIRRDDRRAIRGSSGTAWIGGVVLIALGGFFLFQNYTNLDLGNWWALFILLPALAAFANAWNAYRQAGNQLNAAARGSIIGGLVLTMVSAMFLFNLDWGMLWPVFLVLIGLGVLLNSNRS